MLAYHAIEPDTDLEEEFYEFSHTFNSFEDELDALSKDDLSLFEDAELDYQMFEITSR